MKYLILILCLCLGLLPPMAMAQKSKTQRVNTRFEKGVLTNGRPTGLWEYFDYNGARELAIDYDSSRIVFQQPDTTRYRLRIGTEWRTAQPSRPPQFMGSKTALMQYFGTYVKYPAEAIRNRQQGVVVVGFTVSAQGQAVDFVVEQSVSAALDEQALRLLQSAPNRWVPAVYLGRPTDARFRAMVHFTLANQGETSAEVSRRVASSPPRRDELTVLVTAYTDR